MTHSFEGGGPGVLGLRTEPVLWTVPVLRSAYLQKTVHRTIFRKTLDLQGFAPSRKTDAEVFWGRLCVREVAQALRGTAP